jgi:hypothetical protein
MFYITVTVQYSAVPCNAMQCHTIHKHTHHPPTTSIFLTSFLSPFHSTFLVGYQRLEGSVIGAIYAFAMFQLLDCSSSEVIEWVGG